ncbi:PLP-dependent aminotransferase family protein [Hydrogenophaga aromaticivorans]|uniref:aminotransferase-like domain-containing protein n=1 Tax=Hydrogenophaga aromaticivorans TaxID=2610898 RepID=UPI001B359437|nr:PLP-dependent aminotransferase family protein [Hydrogenophaga aromaticivorans]MBQ0917680.1 PLP-dependent aminotransferase family protein [Hydrogenophaga aromaticivorans]
MPAPPSPLALCPALSVEPVPALPLYQQIAQTLAQLIHSGAFKVGQRLPSVRATALAQGVSISTAMQAYRQLEEQGLVQARPKAGYFVRRAQRIAQPGLSAPPQRSFLLERQSRSEAFAMLHQPGDRATFGGFTPQSSELFDEERLRVAIGRASRVHRHSLTEYNKADAGRPALRRAVAQRALQLGCALDASDIVITASCTQAVSLCLRAVTQPGDVVALESPTFFGYLDLIESLGLRVLEIPTHPATGLSLPALELALDTQPVKAVLAAPTLSNPLGSVMPLAAKQRLVRLLAQRRVPLIEDVVFNDLLSGDERRKAAKSWDTEGNVMVCGSFAKTLTPGIRLGWVEAGRWRDAVATHKRLQGAATNVVLEEALADLLTQGSYEAHLRRLTASMRQRRHEARHLIAHHFPPGTRVSNPPSGDTLWLELHPAIASMDLFKRCASEGITFGPGELFTATDRYRHCLRLNFSGPWNAVTMQALARIGEIARQMLERPTADPTPPVLRRA